MGIFGRIKDKFKKQDAEEQINDDAEPEMAQEVSSSEQLDGLYKQISQLNERIYNIENNVSSMQENFSQKKEEKVVIPEANLSEQEKEIINYIETNEKGDANSIAEALGMSRSNASLKLNKLFNWNILDKKVDDRKVMFCLKVHKREDIF